MIVFAAIALTIGLASIGVLTALPSGPAADQTAQSKMNFSPNAAPSQLVQTNANPSIPPGCVSSFPGGLQLLRSAPVPQWTGLIMPPGSTASLCITWSTNSQNINPSDFAAQIDNVTVTHYPGGDGFSYSNASGVSITFDPSTIHYSSINQSSFAVTVVYTLTSSSTAHGFFTLVYPNHCPAMIPFAVVGGPQQVTASNYPEGFFFLGSCPLTGSPSSPKITGFGGITTTAIDG